MRKFIEHIECCYFRAESIYRDIKIWCIDKYQKLLYGASDVECWDLNVTLAKYILKKLKYFKKMKRYGAAMEPDPNKPFIAIPEKEWEEILDKMIFAFEFIVDEEKFIPFPETTLSTKEGEEMIQPPAKDKVWADYLKTSEEFVLKRDEGLDLFRKHYSNLGD